MLAAGIWKLGRAPPCVNVGWYATGAAWTATGAAVGAGAASRGSDALASVSAMYALKLMPAVIAACSTWLRSSGAIRTDMTDVRGVPVFGALMVIGPARGDQRGRLFTVGGGKGYRGKAAAVYTSSCFLFTCLRIQKHISLCARYSVHSYASTVPACCFVSCFTHIIRTP